MKRTINVWSPDAIDALQDCFVDTEWEVFKEGNDLHSFTDTVTAYIKFCITSKTVTQYPNNQPWCDKSDQGQNQSQG